MTLHIEPHDPEHSVGLSAGKQIGDLRDTNVRRNAGLSNQHRAAAQLMYLTQGSAKQVDKLDVGLEIVPVNTDPRDLGGSRPPRFNRANLRAAYDVNRP
jgi:hypothetical protein